MEQSSNDVQQDSSPVVSEDVKPQMQSSDAPVEQQKSATSPVGSKTPQENLYAALEEERRKNQILKDKLNNLNTTVSLETEFVSDEGRVLKGNLDAVSAELKQLREERDLEKLCAQYPALKDNVDKFNEFRQTEHPSAKIESAAKLFLAENGLLEGRRVGLENPTGGPRQAVNPGMTVEDIANLRKNNWKKYQDMLSKGLIKIEA